MAVGALINRAWRLFGTGLSFTVFGVGGLFLAVLVFPAISVFPGTRKPGPGALAGWSTEAIAVFCG